MTFISVQYMYVLTHIYYSETCIAKHPSMTIKAKKTWLNQNYDYVTQSIICNIVLLNSTEVPFHKNGPYLI